MSEFTNNLGRDSAEALIMSEKLIQRVLRYSRLVKVNAPDVILANEMAMIQEVLHAEYARIGYNNHNNDSVVSLDDVMNGEIAEELRSKYKGYYAEMGSEELIKEYLGSLHSSCLSMVEDRGEYLLRTLTETFLEEGNTQPAPKVKPSTSKKDVKLGGDNVLAFPGNKSPVE
ncbi:hypothetical protein ABGV42_01500 [Paenibacillus pabuli]|uniref:hypothetical protein n=1 Tax=Paenibacillus pabuli TaxID=1472 RepID=UPI003242FBD1